MKRLLNLLLAILMTVSLAMVPGCGLRKVQDNKTETKDSVKEESKSEGNVAKETSSGGTAANKEIKDKTDEAQNSKVTEVFDENGRLKQRITELENKKSVDKSTNESNSTWYIHTKTDSIFNNHIYSDRIITIRTHSRNVDRDSTWVKNVGGWGTILALAIIIGIVIFAIARTKRFAAPTV